MNIVEAIPDLYPLTSSGKYKAEFENEEEARQFTLGIRDLLKEVGIGVDSCYEIVEQRNSNVYMDVEYAEKVLEQIQEEEFSTV